MFRKRHSPAPHRHRGGRSSLIHQVGRTESRSTRGDNNRYVSSLGVPNQLTFDLSETTHSMDRHPEELKSIRESRIGGVHCDRAAKFDGGAVEDGPAFEVAEAGHVSDPGVERVTMFVCLRIDPAGNCAGQQPARASHRGDIKVLQPLEAAEAQPSR